MLPTTSSKSRTLKAKGKTSPPVQLGLETPVQFIKGVGPRLGVIFAKRDILTVRDLLQFFPRTYEDRSRLKKISELVAGESATLSLSITGISRIPVRGGRTILDVRASDGKDLMHLKWFHAPRGMEGKFKPGAELIVTGSPKEYRGQFEIIHPEVTFEASAASTVPVSKTPGLHSGRVVPIYVEIEGISSRVFRKILWEAIEKYCSLFDEDVPEHFLERHGLGSFRQAVRHLHFPPETVATETDPVKALSEFKTLAHQRLIYDEFFKFEYLILRSRLQMTHERATAFEPLLAQTASQSLERALPFTLTDAQKKSLAEILGDLAKPHPMNRLIQGDVGSGKTAVAFLAAAAVLAAGFQAALMAPTEILAEQHAFNARKLFGGKLNVAVLTGKTPSADRRALASRLLSGEPLLLIGTHALIEEPVQFACLQLVLIDEQHRFGVEQRRSLMSKGKPHSPHVLVLSATPIPRTLALTAYGDLAISSIRELPPGRQPITTRVLRGSERKEAAEKIRQEVARGRQAYWIFPLIEESEAEGFEHLRSATSEFEKFQREDFQGLRLGLLHGSMNSAEKTAVMEKFKSGEFQILVSTTVVEVGVDVPNASVIAIEHAERFGLSQLHQLRGRVGRGSDPAFCFLLTRNYLGETTETRLEVLEATTDGFKIAEADLEIRGPGEFLGTRQAGGLPFKLANLVRDQAWLVRAREDAIELLKGDPDLVAPTSGNLRRFLAREGRLQSERLKTS